MDFHIANMIAEGYAEHDKEMLFKPTKLVSSNCRLYFCGVVRIRLMYHYMNNSHQ